VAEPALQDDNDISVEVLPDLPDNVRVDPVTGATEIDTEDGGVVVQFGAAQTEQQNGPEDLKDFYRNLADDVGDERLSTIAEDLIQQIEADDSSRKEVLSTRSRGLGLLGLQLDEPGSTVGDTASSQGGGMSVVTNPLLLDACLKAWANAQAELLPADGPCKVEDFEPEESEAEADLGETFERDMNYWLTTVATEYYPETAHTLLWGTVFGGSGIKKVSNDPMLRRPSSRGVDIKDLIVSDTTKDLKSCERITHQIQLRPSEMKRLQMRGFYREIQLAPPTQPEPTAVDQKVAEIQGVALNANTRPEDQPYTLWETQCELLLPEFQPKAFADKGIALPFLVTIEKDSRQILAIRRDWKPDDEDCRRKQMYVKYPYVPGPGFYGTGMLNILGNASAAMTAAWRLTLDAGMYANFPSGVISKLGNRQNSVLLRPNPGEFVPIDTNDQDIRQIIQGLPFKDVTSGILALMDKITGQSKEAGGAVEIPVGEGVKDIPVGTMLAYIESSTKVIAAAHKGMHTAQSEELGLLADLFREDPEAFWRGNRKAKKFWNEQKLFMALNACNLVPKSDPNVPSHVHRLMKAVALIQLLQVPAFSGLLDPREILNRVLRSMKEDPTGIVVPPQPVQPHLPTPDEINAAAKMKDADTKAGKLELEKVKEANDSAERMQEIRGEAALKTIDLAQTLVAHQGDQKNADRTHVLNANKHALDIVKHAHEATMDAHAVLNSANSSSGVA
jgi:hypothetical protein